MPDITRPKYYSVVINNITGPAPYDGFIDNLTIEMYGRNGLYPTTLELARTKARANYRFRRMAEDLSVMQSVKNLIVFANDATNNSEPSQLTFTVVFDRPEYVFTYNEEYPAMSSTEILLGEDAIRRVIARVFFNNTYFSKAELPRNPNSANQGYEWIREDLEIGGGLLDLATIESFITVTDIPFTSV